MKNYIQLYSNDIFVVILYKKRVIVKESFFTRNFISIVHKENCVLNSNEDYTDIPQGDILFTGVFSEGKGAAKELIILTPSQDPCIYIDKDMLDALLFSIKYYEDTRLNLNNDSLS